MSPSLHLAIIDSNMLACMGLQHILRRIIPFATPHVFSSFDAFTAEEGEGDVHFAHFFVAARIYFEHTAFFRPQAFRTIVLVNGENLPPMPGIFTLNIARSEQELTTDLLQLHAYGHGNGPHQPRHYPMASTGGHPTPLGTADRPPHGMPSHPQTPTDPPPHPILTPREIAVVGLLAKGCINKEVAEHLNISLATVVTHRKNIMTKLNAHSLSDVIIYAVINGLMDLGE